MIDDEEPRIPPTGQGRWLDSDNVWTYFLPMLVFLGLGQFFVPAQPDPGEVPEPNQFGLTYDQYPMIYAGILVAVLVTLWFCRAGWGQWKFRVSPLAIGVGVVGIVLWVACCELKVEERFVEAIGEDSPAMGVLGMLGLGAERPAFNPFERIEDTASRWAFIVVRFLGLVLMVPVFEELLLRGYLMRSIVSPDLSRVPFGRVTTASVLVGTAFPMLYHPEKLAALVWFSLITWLMVRTKNYWDCVAAHATTNFLLGVYVLWTSKWYLW